MCVCVLRAYPLGFALKYLKYFDYLKKNKGFLRIEPAKALPTHILKRERETGKYMYMVPICSCMSEVEAHCKNLSPPSLPW